MPAGLNEPCIRAGSAAGQERSIPAPSEAAQSTKASGDLLRRFKEMKQSLTNELQEAPVLTDAEVALRVCPDKHTVLLCASMPAALPLLLPPLSGACCRAAGPAWHLAQ